MAKDKFDRKKPHVNDGPGCLGQLRALAIGLILILLVGIFVLVLAPTPTVQAVMAPFDSARGALGRGPLGGPGDFGLGYDPTCPQGAPFRCDDGSCVLTPSMCDPGNTCPPDMPLMCVDGECVAEPEDCTVFPDCPGVTPYQCWNGACEPAPSYCEDRPLTADVCQPPQFLCPDGSCVADRTLCPAPGGLDETSLPVLLADSDPELLNDLRANDGGGGIGVLEATEVDCHQPGSGSPCSAGRLCCCWIDVVDPDSGESENVGRICGYLPSPNPPPPPPASCPDGQVLCPDGTCVANAGQCAQPPLTGPGPEPPVPPPCPSGQFECPDGSCVLTPSACEEPPPSGDGGEQPPCPTGQFQCPDGSCVLTPSACEPQPPGGGGPGSLSGG